MAEDILKRINEILEQGIKATGIDADPDAPNYLTDYPTEHGDLIRELEKNGTLEELQNLVGGEEKLGDLIREIADKQSEVSPRYLSATPPLNEYGEEFGAKGAYGITTAELQQKEIQDVIKNFIDTPTNVVDDFYVVTPEQLSNAIEEMKKGFGDTLPEIQYDTHGDLISELEQTLASQGFDYSDGREDDLRVVLDDWLTGGGTFEDTRFFNNFPKIENLPDPQNIRGFVAAAGGPEEIKEGYVQPQYFKDKPNVPYVDAPTDVVDDAPLLETRMTQRNQGGLEWADDVITPNKVFNPDALTRLDDASAEDSKVIWTRTTEFDAKAMYQRILDNKATDEDITKFFIYLASHSPQTAFANSPFNQQHSIADIVKIGIFRDIPLTQVIPMGVPYQEAMFLDELFTNNNEIGDEIKKVLVELVTEQGQFQNLRERMRKVIMDAHKAVYANNPNDYFVVWRGGELNRFHPWQSTSKSYDSSNQVMMQMKQAGFANRYNVPDTYIVHKNNMIDLDALGLSWMDEKEIIVLTEELKSPFAKWEVPLYSDKEIAGLEEWWSTAKTDTDSFPKNGKQITNISQSLSDAGQSTQDFFNIVLDGLDPRYIPNSGYQQLIDLNNTNIYKFQDDYNKFVASGGSFNQHIFTSVPTFYEAQVVKMAALSYLVEQNPLERGEFGGPAQPYKILDIGGTEGAWAKGLGKNNPLVDIEVLDPSLVAEAKFNSGELVTNVKFTNEAFSHKLGDQDKFFIEQGQKPVRFKVFTDADKYDIIHESMAFQFIDGDRAGQIKYIKENLLNENGILIIEEKFLDDNKAIYDANEAKKDAFKRQYYTEEQLNNKKFNVLLDMEGKQVSVQEIQKILGENFANVEQYWDSGNFKGFIASDSPVIESFKTGMQELDVSLTNHQYSTAPTNAEIKASINKMTYNHGTDKKLAAKIAEETVAQSPQYFNKLSKIAARFGVVGGTALAGLAKLAPALAPGDFAIEKAIEKSVPYLDDAAARLGFARIPFKNILPTYVAYEVGVAGADIIQAAMYAYDKSQQLPKPSAAAFGSDTFQESLTRLLLPKAYEEEAIKRSQVPGDLLAFYQTPTGKRIVEEMKFGNQFIKELDQEKISKYSPGWGLTKGLLSILGELAQYEAPEVTLNSSDYTTKLKENPAMIYNAGITGNNK